MKFSLLALTSLLALAVAQESSGTSTASATQTLSPEATCAKKCDETDRCCIASCYHVPCPSDQQANDTVSCVAACPQGTGSPGDTEKYASCQNSCYSSHFFPISATGSSGSKSTGTASSNDDASTTKGSSATGTSGSKTGSTGSSSGTGTASGTSSSSSSTETPNAAALKMGVSTMGVIGIVLGALAL